MTKDEAIYVLKNAAWLGSEEQAEKVSEAVRLAIEALKRETSGDAIDRQEAIRIASGYCHFTNVAKELEKLPSVQPEPLTDKEQRIFLMAMEREEKVCEDVDRNYVGKPYEDSLMRACKEIRRKVKSALWTR